MRHAISLRGGFASCALLVLAAALLPAALAASGTLDARRLALQPSDLPASAKRMSEKESRSAPLPGGAGRVYTTTFQFQAGRRTKAVGTIVIAAPSAAVARRVFAAAHADARQNAAMPLSLPALGDEQFAALYGRPAADEASAAVWVRKSTVVWQIQVSSVKSPFGFSKTEARAELTRFALKQKQRVGTS